MVLALILEFSKLSLTTAIMTLTPVSCYYRKSLSYGGKERTDVGLDCRCHLTNIMSDKGDFFKGDNHCLPQHKRDGFSCLMIITLMDLEKPYAITD